MSRSQPYRDVQARIALTREKYKLLAADPHCWFCGRKVCENCARLDHLEPVAAGGSDERDNLVLACWACNVRKANRLLAEIVVDIRRGCGVVSAARGGAA